jgi:uncharacterized protein YwqG
MQIPESILESLEQKQINAATSFLADEIAPCFRGVICGDSESSSLTSRLGGKVLLPREIGHPCDRSGKPMSLVAQINFSELPAAEFDYAKQGLLILFCNAARDFSNPKDRNAFRCVWIANPVENNYVDSAFPDATVSSAKALNFSLSLSLPEDLAAGNDEQAQMAKQISNALEKDRQIQLFGKGGKDFDVLQEIAAFAGNGISWSEARRTDSCFSHLVESAAEWKLLLKMNSTDYFDLADRSLYLLIRDEDLKQQSYGKSWLVVR